MRYEFNLCYSISGTVVVEALQKLQFIDIFHFNAIEIKRSLGKHMILLILPSIFL